MSETIEITADQADAALSELSVFGAYQNPAAALVTLRAYIAQQRAREGVKVVKTLCSRPSHWKHPYECGVGQVFLEPGQSLAIVEGI